MEYLAGGSLRTDIEREGTLTAREARRVLRAGPARARGRTRTGHRPPRHQARQRAPRGRRLRQADRLRPGPLHVGREDARPADAPGARHAVLHVTGGRDGLAGHAGIRSVERRRSPLSHALRAPARSPPDAPLALPGNPERHARAARARAFRRTWRASLCAALPRHRRTGRNPPPLLLGELGRQTESIADSRRARGDGLPSPTALVGREAEMARFRSLADDGARGAVGRCSCSANPASGRRPWLRRSGVRSGPASFRWIEARLSPLEGLRRPLLHSLRHCLEREAEASSGCGRLHRRTRHEFGGALLVHGRDPGAPALRGGLGLARRRSSARPGRSRGCSRPSRGSDRSPCWSRTSNSAITTRSEHSQA